MKFTFNLLIALACVFFIAENSYSQQSIVGMRWANRFSHHMSYPDFSSRFNGNIGLSLAYFNSSGTLAELGFKFGGTVIENGIIPDKQISLSDRKDFVPIFTFFSNLSQGITNGNNQLTVGTKYGINISTYSKINEIKEAYTNLFWEGSFGLRFGEKYVKCPRGTFRTFTTEVTFFVGFQNSLNKKFFADPNSKNLYAGLETVFHIF